MLTAIGLGLVQGVRHAFEPDHLAAVSVLVGESRDVRRGAWLGAIWGLGHTLALAALGVALLAFEAALPAGADRVFQLLVAATLVVLGVRALWRTHHAVPRAPVRGPIQALLVGAIHGLAGSSPLIALVLAALPDPLSRILYISLFGAGSIAGMALVSMTASAWLGHVARSALLRALLYAISLWSIGVGLWTAWRALHP